MELSTMTTRAQQQRHAAATQFDSSDFFVRIPEEYEGTLIVLTTRIEESYGYLNQLLCILSLKNRTEKPWRFVAAVLS